MADIDNLNIKITTDMSGVAEALKKVSDALRTINEQLDRIDPSRMDGFSKAAQGATDAAKSLQHTVKDLGDAVQNVSQHMGGLAQVGDAARNIGNEFGNASRQTNTMAGALREAAQNVGSTTGSFSTFNKIVDGIARAVFDAASQLTVLGKVAKNAFGVFIVPAKLAANAVKKLATSHSVATNTAKKFAKELFRVSKMLKLMVTRMALRAVIKEVGNGFKSLAIHSEAFNQSVSGMMNGAKKLGYSFSAMISPLINAFAPAIVYVINLLVKLANVINQVFSALTGMTTYNRSKDFAEDWASNIESANKQAKQLKKTVLGFDELNQLQEKYSGGGDTSGNIVDMFETMPIEDKWKEAAAYIKNIAKKLFDPIKKAWEKVGDFVKKSWKYAMDEVFKLGKSVARDFWEVWQQEDTQKIFESILKFIGYIGQAVGNLAKRFREAWDKNDRGLHILENIRDIVLIVVQGFERMAEATAEWADNLDFEPILEAVENWLASCEKAAGGLMGILEDFYTTVILPLGKWAVEEGGPALLKVFTDFNDKIEWDSLREKLKTLWEHLEPFMETVGEGLIIFINDCAQALADFINSETFENFLKTIEDWMDNVTPQDVADGLKAIAKAILAFEFGKAVLAGLAAVSSFVTTIAALAPLLKLSIVITVGYLGLKLGGLLGRWLTSDDETYEQYTIPVMIKWSVEEFPESWTDFQDKVKDWGDAWMRLRQEAELFVRTCARIVEGPIISTFLDLYQIAGGKKANGQTMTFSGGAGADIDSAEWEKTIEAAKEATEQANAYRDAKEKIPKAWGGSSGGSGANIESDDWQMTIEAVREATGVTGEYKSKVDEVQPSLKKTSGAAKDLSTNVDTAKTGMNKLKGATDDLVGVTPVLTQKQKEYYDALNKSSEGAKTATTGLDNLRTSAKNYADIAPVMNKSQQEFIDSLGDVKVETEEVGTQFANTGAEMSGVWQEQTRSASESMGEIVNTVTDGTKDMTSSLDDFKDGMSEDSWTFSGVWEGLKKTFSNAVDGIKKIWNKFVDDADDEGEIGGGKFRIKLPKFAGGGFPENGLFLANSTELVGRFSNGKTAVANNEQIVNGISAGVYNAVTAAMANSSGSNNGGYIANTIVVDGEVIARTVTRAQQKQNMRYSPQMG